MPLALDDVQGVEQMKANFAAEGGQTLTAVVRPRND